ncbi:MAG TPA: GNAT family N-acetyltransferase [Pyrinomonadaceae bacterium]|nr:GNAT family N-acetyltransferase [Pyrinomonadaceae bacterium]
MPQITELSRNEYTVSTDRSLLNIALIHEYLSNSTYWATGRKLEVVQRSIDNSLCFGVFKTKAGGVKEQVGFARVVTDYATFAWIADVFILEEHRGKGLGKWLIDIIVEHPELQGFRRWVLATKDAHELYRRVGFRELHRPERWMERPDPNMQENPDYWNAKSSEA